MPPVPLILVSNDDGIHSDGLRALADAVAAHGRVVVVAPDREQSAVSHALTLHRPLRIDELEPGRYTVDGTPTDCVNLGINAILRERPALVISGINKGANLGDDVTYSGTVSAAMEGTLLGVPSIAVSQIGRGPYDFSIASTFTAELVARVLANPLPADTLLNVNVPQFQNGEQPRGVALTRLGKPRYRGAILQKGDPRGRKDHSNGRRRGGAVPRGGGHGLRRRQPGQHLGDADPPRPHQLRVVRCAAPAGGLVAAGRPHPVTFERERDEMVVRQLQARGIRDARVLEA